MLIYVMFSLLTLSLPNATESKLAFTVKRDYSRNLKAQLIAVYFLPL